MYVFSEDVVDPPQRSTVVPLIVTTGFVMANAAAEDEVIATVSVGPPLLPNVPRSRFDTELLLVDDEEKPQVASLERL